MAVARLWACFSGGIPQFVAVAAVAVVVIFNSRQWSILGSGSFWLLLAAAIFGPCLRFICSVGSFWRLF